MGLAGSVDEPVPVARPGVTVQQTVRLRVGRRERDARGELDRVAIRLSGALGGRSIAWRDARSISVDRGRVGSERAFFDFSRAHAR